ncbi:hypothetical protein [uncultured Sphingomonas sp.]|uniref:hypothetical protein n=1 Tax=uncultured Sphingomonas sp. TaxID=158754 RepID=UPI0026225BAA|nr:hypothetical protein [uncultured Sphingomonas sp.]
MRLIAWWMLLAAAMVAAPPAAAQSIPFADTEDATLSEIEVDDADFHPVVSVDLRNGDYARGALDDDDAGLGRVPLHVALGGAAAIHRRADGRANVFLIGQSSNGFHAPADDERARPRAWYESNNLLGLAWRPVDGLNAAATYTIKISPNGVAPTTHEASLTVLYSADDGLGRLKPRAAVTRRTRGDGGFYTIAGIAPSFDLSERERGPSISLPVTIGIGWRGFYAAGSGDRLFGSAGVSLARPMRLGRANATLQAEMLGLLRDDRLRRLDAPGGTTATIVPYATVSFSVAL